MERLNRYTVSLLLVAALLSLPLLAESTEIKDVKIGFRSCFPNDATIKFEGSTMTWDIYSEKGELFVPGEHPCCQQWKETETTLTVEGMGKVVIPVESIEWSEEQDGKVRHLKTTVDLAELGLDFSFEGGYIDNLDENLPKSNFSYGGNGCSQFWRSFSVTTSYDNYKKYEREFTPRFGQSPQTRTEEFIAAPSEKAKKAEANYNESPYEIMFDYKSVTAVVTTSESPNPKIDPVPTLKTLDGVPLIYNLTFRYKGNIDPDHAIMIALERTSNRFVPPPKLLPSYHGQQAGPKD